MKINKKILIVLFFFIFAGFEINKIYLKLYVYEEYKTGTNPSFFYDGYFGFFTIFIEIILILSTTYYNFLFLKLKDEEINSENNLFLKIGKFITKYLILFNKYLINKNNIKFSN
jgi:hypothetical protein